MRHYLENSIPGVKVFLSCPIVRTDNKQANVTLRKLDQDMKSLENIIPNDNVDTYCLGKKGLHLNGKGCGRLAMNYISQMQCL